MSDVETRNRRFLERTTIGNAMYKLAAIALPAICAIALYAIKVTLDRIDDHFGRVDEHFTSVSDSLKDMRFVAGETDHRVSVDHEDINLLKITVGQHDIRIDNLEKSRH